VKKGIEPLNAAIQERFRHARPCYSSFLWRHLLVLGTLLFAIAATRDHPPGRSPGSPVTYPDSKRTRHADTYHGVRVADPYRWLENLKAAEVTKWLHQETDLTVTQGKLFPSLEPFRQRIRQIQNFRSLWPPVQAGGKLFFIETSGNVGGSSTGGVNLFVQSSPSGQTQILLESKTLFPDGRQELLRFFQPSEDGRLLVYATSKTGSRWLKWRILNVETGRDLAEVLLGGHQLVSTIAWTRDNRGFYYGRFGEPAKEVAEDSKVQFERLYFHRIGTPQSADELILENVTEGDRWFVPSISEDGQCLLITSGRGASPNVDVFLKRLFEGGKQLESLNSGMKGWFYFLGNKGPEFYFLTDWNAPRKTIISVRIDLPRGEAWRTLIPEGEDAIVHASLVADRFIMQCSKDAAPLFKIFARSGRFEREIKIPALGNIWGAPWGPGFVGARTDPETFFSLTGLADPGSIYRLDPRSGNLSLWKRPNLSFDPDQFVTEHVLYSSRDGHRVPMFIVHKKGLKRTGENPAWLYAYGALGWSSFPWFQPQMVAWLENGGIFALAGIRGGGEYGETWHQAGIKLNRQRAIDDYFSAAEWLTESGYTSYRKLAVNGGSLSGSLPAVALIRHPDMFAAAVVDIPVLDMIRYSKHTGAQMWIRSLVPWMIPLSFERY